MTSEFSWRNSISLCPASFGDAGSQFRYLGWEDPLKEGMATHSNILTRIIPWTEESGGLQSMGSQSRT